MLRALFIIPGLAALIESTLQALPALASVGALWALVIWMMMITGVQLFKGSLHTRCVLLPHLTEDYIHPESGKLVFCSLSEPAADVGGGNGVSGGRSCPGGVAACAYREANPAVGTLSFDSALDAIFPLVHTLIGDSWSANMYTLMDAGSSLAWLYFCPLAALGGFVLVQLFLAVISESFIDAENTRKALEYAQTRLVKRLQARWVAPKGNGLAPTRSRLNWARSNRPTLRCQTHSHPSRSKNATPLSRRVRGHLARRKHKARRAAAQAAAQANEGGVRCCGRRFRPMLRPVMRLLSKASQVVVLYNVVIMGLRYHREPQTWSATQVALGDVATYFFMVEMAVRLAYFGWRGYWADGWNVLDGSLVLSSVVEIVLRAFFSDLLVSGAGFTPMLRMLRMLRIVRALKAATSMPTLQKMIESFVESIPQVLNLVIFMFVVMFIFGVIGMQLFGGTGISETSRLHFDSFPAAMTCILTILLGKYVVIYQAGCEAGHGLKMAVFVYSACLVLYLTIVNLFVAILVQAFSTDDDDEEEEEAVEEDDEEEEQGEGHEADGGGVIPLAAEHSQPEATVPSRAKLAVEQPVSWLVSVARQLVGPARGFVGPARQLVGSKPSKEGVKDLGDPLPTKRRATCCDHLDVRPRRWFERLVLLMILLSSITIAIDVPRLPADSPTKHALECLTHVFTFTFVFELIVKLTAWGSAAYFGDPWNVLDFCIVAASMVALLVFAFPELEALVAIRVLRVLRPLRLLARNEGTRLVMTVLFTSFPIVSAILTVVIFVMTVFASARSLPMATKSPYHSLPRAFSHYRTFTFGPRTCPPVVGMFMFMGTFASCSESAAISRAACDAAGAHWRNPWVGNFDSFGAAMLTLFQAVTSDTLPDLMIHGMDAANGGVDVAPVPTDWSWSGLFFVVWILVGNFMALNLFVGAIVDNFISLRAEVNGSAMLTPAQKQWVAVQLAARNARAAKRPCPPSLPDAANGPISSLVYNLRVRIYQIVLSAGFQNVMLLLLLINLNMLAFDFHRMDEYPGYAFFSLAADAFYYLYWIEFGLKLFALGISGFLADGGRVFELLLLVLSLLERYSSSLVKINPMVLRLLRLSRVLKTLKLIARAEELRSLLGSLVEAGPALLNVGLILVVVVFIYAVLGMHLFTCAPPDQLPPPQTCSLSARLRSSNLKWSHSFFYFGGARLRRFVMLNQGINEHANFRTLGGSFLLLFQVLTGDSWSAVMWGAMAGEENGCDASPADGSPSSCGSLAAVPFFLSFIVIGNLVFLNLIVAVVLENFAASKALYEEQTRRRTLQESELVTEDHIDEFTRLWGWFDTDADNQIAADRLPYLIARLRYPLGLKGKPPVGTSQSRFGDRSWSRKRHAPIGALENGAGSNKAWRWRVSKTVHPPETLPTRRYQSCAQMVDTDGGDYGRLADPEVNDPDEQDAADAALRAREFETDQRSWVPNVELERLKEAEELIVSLLIADSSGTPLVFGDVGGRKGEQRGGSVGDTGDGSGGGSGVDDGSAGLQQVWFNVILDALLENAFRNELKVDPEAIGSLLRRAKLVNLAQDAARRNSTTGSLTNQEDGALCDDHVQEDMGQHFKRDDSRATNSQEIAVAVDGRSLAENEVVYIGLVEEEALEREQRHSRLNPQSDRGTPRTPPSRSPRPSLKLV